ncbi:MAG: polysaccharide deacetylase family protein [Chloroflexi bacterium]|nr:MAG: polysaccharide deacetylase family protein [Chloroflexota bacterium]
MIGRLWPDSHDGKHHPLTSPAACPSCPVATTTLPSPTPSLPLPSVLGFPLFSGNPDLPEIALTFDDGPNPVSTPQILILLQRSGISATFYVIGAQAQAYPALVKQELQLGHMVGNHTWTHPPLTSLSSNAVYNELQSTSQAIQAATGSSPIVFRPPYGQYNSSVQGVAARLGLSTVLWSIDSKDWSKPGTSAIIESILSTTHNGSIILLHDGGGDRSQTVAALPTILTTLTQRGFQFVTVARLMHDLPHGGTRPT